MEETTVTDKYDFTILMSPTEYDSFWRYHVINTLANFLANPYEAGVTLATLTNKEFSDLYVNGKLENGKTEITSYVNVGRS